MEEPVKNTFPKKEHLSSLLLIGKLFAGGSKSLAVFPLRAVYMPVENAGLPAVSVLISVSKKRFKRAVKRNRVKRQIREAYRKNKKQKARNLRSLSFGSMMSFMLLRK